MCLRENNNFYSPNKFQWYSIVLYICMYTYILSLPPVSVSKSPLCLSLVAPVAEGIIKQAIVPKGFCRSAPGHRLMGTWCLSQGQCVLGSGYWTVGNISSTPCMLSPGGKAMRVTGGWRVASVYWTFESSGHKPCWLSEQGVLWTHTSGGSSESLRSSSWIQTLCSSWEGRNCEFCPSFMLLCRGWGL